MRRSVGNVSLMWGLSSPSPAVQYCWSLPGPSWLNDLADLTRLIVARRDEVSWRALPFTGVHLWLTRRSRRCPRRLMLITLI
jgi:hypothetical protein